MKKIRLRLILRMFVLILSAAVIIFLSTLHIISHKFKKSALTETQILNNKQAKKIASLIHTSLEEDFSKIRGYKQLIEEDFLVSPDLTRSIFDNILHTFAENNPEYTAVWDSWELRFVDSRWVLPYGRIRHTFFKDPDGFIHLKKDSLNLSGDNENSTYYNLKTNPGEAITNPYYYSYTGLKKDRILETSIVTPINIDNQFAGLVGIDISLKTFQNFIDSINDNNQFNVIFLANNGDIISHPKKIMAGKNIKDKDSLFYGIDILPIIQSGSDSSYVVKDTNGEDSLYISVSSFYISNTKTPWAIITINSLDEIEAQINQINGILKKATILGIITLAIVVLIIGFIIVTPIRKTRKILSLLALGKVNDIRKIEVKSEDELGEMAESVNTVVDGLIKVTEFAEKIKNGQYDSDFKLLSSNDVLGKAIIDMSNSLKKAKEDENRRNEEASQLQWASEGMNIFNKVLQIDNKDIKTLTYNIIITLTNYLDAHMGGIYIKTDQEKNEFELYSFIGFKKEKYEKKYITPDESLLGQCILEKETIFVNDVPKDADIVSSGLGKSLPRSILIVPLLVNDNLIGIIEIESLNNLEKYQIEFVEKIAETIASSISTVKINTHTTTLLDKAKKQAEELEQQEEEMRQNMEEMQATQEEAKKKENELTGLIDAFNNLIPIIEYDLGGTITNINDKYLSIYKLSKNKLIGKRHKGEIFMNESDQVKHKEFWNKLADGHPQESLEYIKTGKEEYWILEKFIPITDKYGLVHKVLCIGIDVTKEQKTESLLKQVKENNFSTKEKKQRHKGPTIDLNKELDIIDLTYLKMVYKRDPGKIYNILKLYYDTLPAQINEVKKLAEERDFKKLKPKISSLKTKMSYLGLKHVYSQLREVEKLLNEEKNLAKIPSMIKDIIKLWMIAYEELQSVLEIKGFN